MKTFNFLRFSFVSIFILTVLTNNQAKGQCTSPILNVGTTTITPNNAWQTVSITLGAIRYVEFNATVGTSYIFTCNNTVGGAAAGVNEEFSILTTANVAAGGTYGTSFMNNFTAATKEYIIWTPTTTATYRLVVSRNNGASCQALLANATVAYTSFSATQNFDVWLGFTSTAFGTASNWLRRTTTGYPTALAPTSAHSVFVPGGGTNQPDCGTTSASVNNLTIYNGATLSMAYTASGALSVYGNVTINGSINHSGAIYIYLYGVGKTFGGSGNFFANVASPFNLTTGSSYTLQNDVSVRHFFIESGASFDMNGFNLSTEFFFQVGILYLRTGNLNIWGNSDASMWYNPGDAINPYFSTDGNFVPGTGTVYYCEGDTYAGANQRVRTTTYYNLKIRTHSGQTTTIGTAGTITVTNDLTFLNTGTAGGNATTTVDVTVGNNLYIGNTGNALTLNLANRIYRAAGTGTLTMGNIVAHNINNTYSSATNYAISGFGASPTFYGTFTYNSSGAQKVIPATYYHFVSTGSGTKTMYGAIDVNGNISFTGGTLTQGIYTINVAGNWTSTGNYYLEGTGKVTIDGTGVSTITGASSSIGGTPNVNLLTQGFNAGTIPATWSTTTLSGTPVLSYPTTSANPAGYTPTEGSNMVRFDSYTCATGSAIRLKKTASISSTGYSNIRVTFDWLKDNGYSGSADNVLVQYSVNGIDWFNGGSSISRYSATNGWTSQSVTLPPGAENQATLYIGLLFTSAYGNNCHLDNVNVIADIAGETYAGEGFNVFEVNKSGGGSVTLASKIMIQTSYTFTEGIMNSTASFYPEFDEDAVVITTPTATCHVNGTVVKRTNTTTKFTFPTGDGSYYRSIAATPSGTGATVWTARYFPSGYGDYTVIGINSVSTVEYWTMDRSGASPVNATIELSWNPNSGVGGNLADLLVAHYDGADWENAGGNNVTGDANNGTIESNANWASYSPFTLSWLTGTPLPITLVEFKATKVNEVVQLEWTTSTEINNDYFTIEKSTNGIDFEPISRINGAGNSNYLINYSKFDFNIEKVINYYRLLQTDFDGKITYSDIVSVDMSKDAGTIIMTVNSIGQEVNSNYSGIVFDVYSNGLTTKRMQ
jgi:hypothetical protein